MRRVAKFAARALHRVTGGSPAFGHGGRRAHCALPRGFLHVRSNTGLAACFFDSFPLWFIAASNAEQGCVAVTTAYLEVALCEPLMAERPLPLLAVVASHMPVTGVSELLADKQVSFDVFWGQFPLSFFL